MNIKYISTILIVVTLLCISCAYGSDYLHRMFSDGLSNAQICFESGGFTYSQGTSGGSVYYVCTYRK